MSKEEALELCNNCTWTLGNLNGVAGCYIKGKNGNQIFVPNAGYKQYKTTFQKSKELYLMLSNTYTDNEVIPNYGYLIFCDASLYGLAGDERSFGYTVRAVTNTTPNEISCLTEEKTQLIIGYYDMQGRKLNAPTKGINIIKYKDGSTKKIIK